MLLFLLSMSATYGQIASLNSAELKVLKRKIKDEADVKVLYQRFEKSAEDFLTQTPNPVDTIRTEGLL